jgi:hypothetical protein
MRRWKQPVSLGCDVYDPDNSRHHQGMDHDVAELTVEPTRNWRNIAFSGASMHI